MISILGKYHTARTLFSLVSSQLVSHCSAASSCILENLNTILQKMAQRRKQRIAPAGNTTLMVLRGLGAEYTYSCKGNEESTLARSNTPYSRSEAIYADYVVVESAIQLSSG